MIYDLDSPKDSPEEIAEFKKEAREYLRRRAKQASYATLVFLASCGCVAPFLAGFPLHRFWESADKFFLLLSMGLLLVFASYLGLAMSAWFYAREVEKIEV
jgi:hypothetical protein